MKQTLNKDASNFVNSYLDYNGKIRSLDRKLSLHGISFTEYLILHSLAGSEEYKLKRIELAEMLSMSASGITRSLRPMEKIGLVQKEAYERDARVSYVKLAPGGLQIYKDASNTMEMAIASLS